LSNYPHLATYLEDKDRKSKFDYAGFNCSLGPNGSFYINNSATGQHHYNLDPSLERELDERLDASGKWPWDPAQVTLGLDGAFVLVGKKGDLFWDLKGKYVSMEKKLQETKQGVQVSKYVQRVVRDCLQNDRRSRSHHLKNIIISYGRMEYPLGSLQRIGI
jgi:hypothetical protein